MQGQLTGERDGFQYCVCKLYVLIIIEEWIMFLLHLYKMLGNKNMHLTVEAILSRYQCNDVVSWLHGYDVGIFLDCQYKIEIEFWEISFNLFKQVEPYNILSLSIVKCCYFQV